MNAPPRVVVIVEDDSDVRQLLEIVLTQAGFEAHPAATGQDAVTMVEELDPLVVTLDISLPDIDGFEVARRIRTFSNAYIVMLTARVDEIDALQGLDAGADDYITKPFRPRELRARIEAMLRRPRVQPLVAGAAPAVLTLPTTPVDETGTPSVTHTADENGVALVVDHLARTVMLDEEEIHLTRSEFDILSRLVTPVGRVSSKEEIARMLRYGNEDPAAPVETSEGRRLDVHMVNLRRKLGDDSSRPRWIETVRGVGYRFRQP